MAPVNHLNLIAKNRGERRLKCLGHTQDHNLDSLKFGLRAAFEPCHHSPGILVVAPQLNVVTSPIAQSDVAVPVKDARAASVVPSVAAAHETPTVLGPSSNGR